MQLNGNVQGLIDLIGEGGSTVTVTPILQSGIEIMTITVDNTTYVIYAPEGGGSEVEVDPILPSGTKIATINVNGVDYDIYSTDYSGDISSLQSDMTAAEGDISTLQSGLSTANSNITTLQGRVTTAEGNITTLQSDMSAAESIIGDGQLDIGNDLTDAVNEINQSLSLKLIAQNIPYSNFTFDSTNNCFVWSNPTFTGIIPLFFVAYANNGGAMLSVTDRRTSSSSRITVEGYVPNSGSKLTSAYQFEFYAVGVST